MTSKRKTISKSDKIKLHGYPTEHAWKAYHAGYFVEAIQVLHGFFEAILHDMLLISRHGNIRKPVAEVWDTACSLSLYQTASVLFVIGKIDKATFDAVCKFNASRNRVIHRLFQESYEGLDDGISRAQYDKAFLSGIRLCKRLEDRRGRML